MNKKAQNERIKLRATFYNNVAVGTLVAGVAIPYANISSSGDAWVNKAISLNISLGDTVAVVKILTSMGIAWFIARVMRNLADTIAQKIEDD